MRFWGLPRVTPPPPEISHSDPRTFPRALWDLTPTYVCPSLETTWRSGETASWLRALIALSEDPGLIPAPTWWFTTVCVTPVPGIQHPLLAFKDTRHKHSEWACMQPNHTHHTYTQTTHTHIHQFWDSHFLRHKSCSVSFLYVLGHGDDIMLAPGL